MNTVESGDKILELLNEFQRKAYQPKISPKPKAEALDWQNTLLEAVTELMAQIERKTAKSIIQSVYDMLQACYLDEVIMRKLTAKYGIEVEESADN